MAVSCRGQLAQLFPPRAPFWDVCLVLVPIPPFVFWGRVLERLSSFPMCLLTDSGGTSLHCLWTFPPTGFCVCPDNPVLLLSAPSSNFRGGCPLTLFTGTASYLGSDGFIRFPLVISPLLFSSTSFRGLLIPNFPPRSPPIWLRLVFSMVGGLGFPSGRICARPYFCLLFP